MQLEHSRRPCSPRGWDQSHGWAGTFRNQQEMQTSQRVLAKRYQAVCRSKSTLIRISANAPHTNLGCANCLLFREKSTAWGLSEDAFPSLFFVFFVIRNLQSPSDPLSCDQFYGSKLTNYSVFASLSNSKKLTNKVGVSLSQLIRDTGSRSITIDPAAMLLPSSPQLCFITWLQRERQVGYDMKNNHPLRD